MHLIRVPAEAFPFGLFPIIPNWEEIYLIDSAPTEGIYIPPGQASPENPAGDVFGERDVWNPLLCLLQLCPSQKKAG